MEFTDVRGEKTEFQFRAMIKYSGNREFGHYTSIRRIIGNDQDENNHSSEFFSFSDNAVYPCRQVTCKNGKIYLFESVYNKDDDNGNEE